MSWLETTGTVNESKVMQGSNMLMSNDEDGESTPVFFPEISYTYQVAGLEYTSKRLTFAGTKSYSKRENAEKAASLYPVGTQLQFITIPKTRKKLWWIGRPRCQKWCSPLESCSLSLG